MLASESNRITYGMVECIAEIKLRLGERDWDNFFFMVNVNSCDQGKCGVKYCINIQSM